LKRGTPFQNGILVHPSEILAPFHIKLTSNPHFIMSWRFRKSKSIGPFRATVSKTGLGTSVGFFGFRLGVSPNGKKYWSFGIPGTGLFYIKYY
jgi:hypothetical protein